MPDIKPCPYCGSDKAPSILEEVAFGGLKEGENNEPNFFIKCIMSRGGCGRYSKSYPTKEEAVTAWNNKCDFIIKEKINNSPTYPQDAEDNEYRYLSPAWLDAIAYGLTAGQKKHPGETWRDIPAKEHLVRAMRHINLYLMGERKEPHIINASMRMMMAFEVSTEEEA